MLTAAEIEEGKRIVSKGGKRSFLDWCQDHLASLEQDEIRKVFADPKLWKRNRGKRVMLYEMLIKHYHEFLRANEPKNLWDYLRAD